VLTSGPVTTLLLCLLYDIVYVQHITIDTQIRINASELQFEGQVLGRKLKGRVEVNNGSSTVRLLGGQKFKSVRCKCKCYSNKQPAVLLQTPVFLNR